MGLQAVPFHSRSSKVEKSPIGGNADHFPPPRRDDQRACRSLGGDVFCHGTFRMEVVDEMVAEFQKQEERRSWLERPSARVYDLILGPPSNWTLLADRLEEAIERLSVEQDAQ
jgi:hypothetical protein